MLWLLTILGLWGLTGSVEIVPCSEHQQKHCLRVGSAKHGAVTKHYTSTCSHVYCVTVKGVTQVHHHSLEHYGHKHLCKHGMHVEHICGCECYSELVGEGFFTHNELGQILSDKAKHILEKNGYHWAKPESTVAVQLAVTVDSLTDFQEKKEDLRVGIANELGLDVVKINVTMATVGRRLVDAAGVTVLVDVRIMTADPTKVEKEVEAAKFALATASAVGVAVTDITVGKPHIVLQATNEPTTYPTSFPTSAPSTQHPTDFPTYAPSQYPTPHPSKSPTPPPTLHPCDEGTHGCDKGEGGECYKDSSQRGWTCGCKAGFWCLRGCDQPHSYHTCAPRTDAPTPGPTADHTASPTYTPSKTPTASPSQAPSKSPTLSPTPHPSQYPTPHPSKSPTPPPTLHPCDEGTHGCDKGEGGECYKDSSQRGWTCGCKAGFWCLRGCDQPHSYHTCAPRTDAPTPGPTADHTASPTYAPSKTPTASPSQAPSKSPTLSPTPHPSQYPTPHPSKSPTPPPTLHPCDEGTHGCDKGEGGECYKDSSQRGWTCGCKAGFWCLRGCDQPHSYHTCAPRTDAPTESPTTMPTLAPTLAPTVHPCDEGSHGCDQGEGGICYKNPGGGIGWTCGCKNTHYCSAGCANPFTAHRCTLITASPTAFPTKHPTEHPTESPTKHPTTAAPTHAPTLAPTVHPCDEGSHGCDQGEGGICYKGPGGGGIGWTCGCKNTHYCSAGCANPFTAHRCTLITASPTAFPTKHPTEHPTESPTKHPTTAAPTHAPTLAPTVHPCDEGSHGCDQGEGGICYKGPGGGGSWTCGCKNTHYCSAGCANPFTAHRCTLITASPTAFPTKHPTDPPTQYPTKSPTHFPTPAPTTSAPTQSPTAFPTKKPSAAAKKAPMTTPAPTFPAKSTPHQNPYKPVYHVADFVHVRVENNAATTPPPTAAPTLVPAPAGYEQVAVREEETAVLAQFSFPITREELDGRDGGVLRRSLVEGFAAALGMPVSRVSIAAIGSRRRRLAIAATHLKVTFEVLSFSDALLEVAKLESSIEQAGAEGSLVANIQQKAMQNGVLTPTLAAMPKPVMASSVRARKVVKEVMRLQRKSTSDASAEPASTPGKKSAVVTPVPSPGKKSAVVTPVPSKGKKSAVVTPVPSKGKSEPKQEALQSLEKQSEFDLADGFSPATDRGSSITDDSSSMAVDNDRGSSITDDSGSAEEIKELTNIVQERAKADTGTSASSRVAAGTSTAHEALLLMKQSEAQPGGKSMLQPQSEAEAPAKSSSVSTKSNPVPAKTKALPAKTKALPAKTKAVPAKTKAVPAKSSLEPTKTKAVPAKSTPAKTSTGTAAPTKSTPTSAKSQPLSQAQTSWLDSFNKMLSPKSSAQSKAVSKTAPTGTKEATDLPQKTQTTDAIPPKTQKTKPVL